VDFFQLAQRFPNVIYRAVCLQFVLQTLGYLGWRSPAVAVLPHQRDRLIETVGLVVIEVIDQNFVR
jgi:hypothetical protein